MNGKTITVILSIFMIMLQGLSAQDYLPMLEANKTWSVSDEKYILLGDTLINETEFHKVYFQKKLEEFEGDSLAYICALREDTETGKVWMVWSDQQEEYLLYDFDVEPGQTINVYPAEYNVFNNPAFFPFAQEFTIEEVLWLEIEGVQRKVIRQSSEYGSAHGTTYNEIWIEGLGSTSGLLYAGITSLLIMDIAYPDLLCVHLEDELLFQSSVHPSGCYNVPATHIARQNLPTYAIHSYPNPFTHQFQLKVEAGVLRFYIYNAAGVLVYKAETEEGTTILTIPAHDWPKGIYIIKAEAADRYYTGKTVKY
ncbi:MAG: T9SS type A sorting domain-containing protein [Bacteroidales bacterium]